MPHASHVRSRCFFGLGLVLAGLGVLAPAPARAGLKPNCRDLTFGGAAGNASNDKVTLRVVDGTGTSVDDSCQLTVQNNESARAFAARLVGAWGLNGSTCPTPNPLPKKSCGNVLAGTRSCNHQFKFKPDKTTLDPDDGLIRLRICCFDALGCKGAKLANVPVSVQTKIFPAVGFSPSVPPPVGITITPVALDPIGMTQRPFSTLQTCRTSLGRAVTKLASTAAATLASCHQDVMLGNLPPTIDCNALTATSDPGQQAAAAADAVRGTVSKSCLPNGPPQTFGFLDAACPCPCQHILPSTCSAGAIGQPCGADADCDAPPGAGNGRCALPGWNLVAECLVCRTEAAVSKAMAATYGTPGPGPGLPPEAEKCEEAIGLGLADLVKTHTTEAAGCQRLVDGGSLGLPAGSTCRDADPKGRRAAAEQAIASKLAGTCPAGSLPPLPGCAATSDPAPCVLANGRLGGGEVTDAVFPESAAPPTCSPGGAFLDPAGG